MPFELYNRREGMVRSPCLLGNYYTNLIYSVNFAFYSYHMEKFRINTQWMESSLKGVYREL